MKFTLHALPITQLPPCWHGPLLAVHSTLGQAYVDAWRQALLVMQQTGVKESLRLTYLEPSNPCANKDTSTLTTSNITVAKASVGVQLRAQPAAQPAGPLQADVLTMVAGLWLFLGAAIGAGYLWNTASWLRERKRPASSIPGVVGHNKHGNANAVAPSGLSATPALDSLAKPSVTWLGVGDASTTEEGMEVLERQVKAMDARMKSMLEAIDQRLERISSSLPVLDDQPSSPPPPAWRPEPRQPSPRAPAAARAVLCAGVGEGVQGAGSRAVPAVDAVKDFHED
ncbi:hypothetical protein V8C86DRAFT_3126911 [Haematococcus lacustris]